MVEEIPPGAIPEEAFKADQTAQPVPEGAIPADEFQSDHDKYGSGIEMAKTAIEQGLSGATLGGSKIIETKLLGVKPEAIAGREAENPGTSFVSNVVGTGSLLGLTGGAGGLLGEGAGLAAKVGAGALEGAGIGAANQVTDDWSQNKALDAQKIVGSAGLGAVLGGLGTGIFEGIKSKFFPLAKVESSVKKAATSADEAAASAAGPPVDPPPPPAGTKGVKSTTYAEMAKNVQEAKENGTAIPLPSQNILKDAISRVELQNPINPAQMDSLGSSEARTRYQTFKQSPDAIGELLTNGEAAQKSEQLGHLFKTIQDISPGAEPTGDAYVGGKQAIESFTKQYKAEQQALKPIFENLKSLPIQGDILPDAVAKMTDAVPGVANMFDTTGAEIAIHPYKTTWGIDKATYNAVKEAVDSLSGADNNLESLWNVRKGLDQHIDVLAQGKAPAEIRAIKAALMDQMQEASGNPEIREAFKRYAINEQQRAVIEGSFGASVGSPEFGQISKVKPEMIGDKIFGNTATVEAAKKILPSEDFQKILSNWISETKSKLLDKGKGGFSSNEFGSFLRQNQDALNVAFAEHPEQLQRLKDLTNIMRILPDSPVANSSYTAPTIIRMLKDTDFHNMTSVGIATAAPKYLLKEIGKHAKISELNKMLSGQALKSSQSEALKKSTSSMSDKIEMGVKSLFGGVASQSRKYNNGTK